MSSYGPGERATSTGGVWHYYVDCHGAHVVEEEVRAMIDAGTPNERKMRLVEFRAKLRAAKEGRLRHGEKEDIADVGGQASGLLEIRCQIQPQHSDPERRYLLRMYFAEPPEVPRLLLGLKAGRKPSDGDPEGIQDGHISEAKSRYAFGRTWDWGLPPDWGRA